VKQIVQDNTIKSEIDKDMYTVPAETVEADFEVIDNGETPNYDPETGEVIEDVSEV
jgi:hypothetical protein